MKNWIIVFNKYRRKINKYHVTFVIFLIVTFSIGDNTFLDGIRYSSKIKSLRKEVEFRTKENEIKLSQLNDLKGDKESLEKFAREQYLMTKPHEELFLIVE